MHLQGSLQEQLAASKASAQQQQAQQQQAADELHRRLLDGAAQLGAAQERCTALEAETGSKAKVIEDLQLKLGQAEEDGKNKVGGICQLSRVQSCRG